MSLLLTSLYVLHTWKYIKVECYRTAPYLIFYILLLFGLVDIIIRFKGGHMLNT